MSDINLQQGFARAGLNTDNISEEIQAGYLTEALNAVVGSFDGKSVTYQTEEGSVHCFTPPGGYKVVGVVNAIQLSQVWYWLANPTTGHSLIGYVANNDCTFIRVIDDSVTGSDLMGLSVEYPIHKVEIKTTNCATQFYWTDKYNPRRFIDNTKLPFFTGTSAVDVNLMNVQPDFLIPQITPVSVEVGGTLIEGDYQFAVQYADAYGEGLTSCYSVTNLVRIFLDGKLSLDYNLQTTKAITVTISNLDTTGLYAYFNLVVVKTINQVQSVELVGTYFIQTSTYTHYYTGAEQSSTNIKLTIADVMSQFDYYDIAGDLTQVDNVLVWADMVKEDDISYQSIFSQVKVYWGTSQMPVLQKEGYDNGVICAGYEGYMRDEVYALEGCFLFANGKQSNRFHIPGRASISSDWDIISNDDATALAEQNCPPTPLPRWKVYNTANVLGNLPGSSDPCTGIKPWQYGEMAYWESTEVYPSNTAIWGSLAGQKIRHHKFPDCIVAPLHDQNPHPIASPGYQSYVHNVYPIGFKVDVNSLYTALQTSSLTPAQKRQIVGFKIMRSDRGANRSIIAKGLLFNCGEYTKEGSSFYYPNYPFNDLNPDPFISSTWVERQSGNNAAGWLNNFQYNRYTFHSPDTHFYQPSGMSGTTLKLETNEYGTCKSHFVQVRHNAGEKILTEDSVYIALSAAILSTIGVQFTSDTTVGSIDTVSVGVNPTFTPQNFFPTYNNFIDLIEKIIPYHNYAWQYNGVGWYGNTDAIPNDTGQKIRYVNFGGYITTGVNSTFGDALPINNSFRESSVYLSLNEKLPAPGVQDTSRVTASQAGVCNSATPFYRQVSSYYASLRNNIVDQYGEIFSYQPVDTGTEAMFFTNGVQITDLPIVYGGDIFINRFALKIKQSFFNKQTVNTPDGTAIDYNQDNYSNTNTGTIGYPINYYSTTSVPFHLSAFTHGRIVDILNILNGTSVNPPPPTIAGVAFSILQVTTGVYFTEVLLMLAGLLVDGLFTVPLQKIINLDCPDHNDLYEKGMAYQYAYGIINFFVESEVNVDMRQAYNINEGNFYPNVGTDIPDEWLQEENVPIIWDNTYTYNKTYSKQNKETAFTTIRPDWQPNQICYIKYNNRAIWSEPSSLEETKNNWLVYKPANTFDFPKSFGQLTGIDRMESRAVLVRYQNHTQIYNAMATVETTAINATLGTGALFSGTQPVDFPLSASGGTGSQNKLLLQTEEGHIYTDAVRGKVIVVRGTSMEELSGPKYLNSKWFTKYLPFNILTASLDIPTDNSYNGIGITGVYDNFYKRLILTKIDYLPLPGVQYINGEWFFGCLPGYSYMGLDPNGAPLCARCLPGHSCNQGLISVTLGDPKYFCNKSWTISFSFLSRSWVSWHSYIPNFYVEYPDYFQAGLNSGEGIYDHNSTYQLYHTYFGTEYPYILEYPFATKNQNDQILQSISDYCTVYLYSSFDQATEVDTTVYFNKATVYNPQQCTGQLLLVPQVTNNLAQLYSYPAYTPTECSILVSKSDHLYNFNMLWDNLINKAQPIWEDTCDFRFGQKVLNTANLSYTDSSFKKYPLRSKECRVRLTLDNNFSYKFVSRFLLVQEQNSVK